MSAWSMMLMRFYSTAFKKPGLKEKGMTIYKRGRERTKEKLSPPTRFFFRARFVKKRGRVEGGFTFENARALLFTNKQFSVRDFIDNEAKRAWEQYTRKKKNDNGATRANALRRSNQRQ
jgi:hypothetical protein